MTGNKSTLTEKLSAFWEDNRESVGKIFVESWIFFYKFKGQFIVPWAVPLLAFLALFDTIAHVTLFSATFAATRISQAFGPWTLARFPWVVNFHAWGAILEIVLNVAVALGSVIVWLDHRQLTADKLISKQTINVLHWLSSAQFWESNSGTLENRLETALKGITTALERPGEDEGTANATILISHNEGQDRGFRILAQHPAKAFSQGEFIPLEGTVAGEAWRSTEIRNSSGLHVYVPWTKFSSGISFRYERVPGDKGKEVLQGKADVYTRVSEHSHKNMGCLLCVGIDLDLILRSKLSKNSETPYPGFVLCFSKRRANSLGESSRHAIVVASKLLPRVFEAL